MKDLKILQTQLPENPQAIVFVYGIKAKNVSGWLYMWRNLNQFRRSPMQIEGCIDLKAGIVAPTEFVVVTYWRDADALKAYFQSEKHREMMKYFYHNADNIELYNETYSPSKPGKYNAAHGIAKIYPLTAG